MPLGQSEASKKFWRSPELVEKLLPFLDLETTLNLARTHKMTRDILQKSYIWNKLVRRSCPYINRHPSNDQTAEFDWSSVGLCCHSQADPKALLPPDLLDLICERLILATHLYPLAAHATWNADAWGGWRCLWNDSATSRVNQCRRILGRGSRRTFGRAQSPSCQLKSVRQAEEEQGRSPQIYTACYCVTLKNQNINPCIYLKMPTADQFECQSKLYGTEYITTKILLVFPITQEAEQMLTLYWMLKAYLNLKQKSIWIWRTLGSSRKSVHERHRNSDGWQVKWSVFWAIWLKRQDP